MRGVLTSALQGLSRHAAAVLAVGVFAGHVLRFIIVAFAANILLQLLGAGVTAAMGRRSALTLGFASGNRNMGLLLAVLPAGSEPDALLFFALAQLPIYILPAALGPAYRRWLARA